MTPLGTARGTVTAYGTSALPGESGKALALNQLHDSWGGTRTLDPGIMSAVL